MTNTFDKYNKTVDISAIEECIYNTDADYHELKNAFLSNLPEAVAQEYTCGECFKFIRKYGGLATIKESGRLKPVMWSKLDDSLFAKSNRAMRRIVKRARVTSRWAVDLNTTVIGNDTCNDRWCHLHTLVPESARNASYNKVIISSKVRYKAVTEFIKSPKAKYLGKAIVILETGAFNKSEFNLGQAKWFINIINSVNNVHSLSTLESNRLWLALYNTPLGYSVTGGSSMLGLLLDGLSSDIALDDIVSMWNTAMLPENYRMTTSKSSDQLLDKAESIVKELGLEKSFERTLAGPSDISYHWVPTEVTDDNDSLFGKLKDKPAPSESSVIVTMNLTDFMDKVVPNAKSVSVRINGGINPVVLVKATNADAPSLFKSGGLFSTYSLIKEVNPTEYNLKVGLNPIAGITYLKELLGETHPDIEDTVYFVTDDGMETINRGTGIFPIILRDELFDISRPILEISQRSVIGRLREPGVVGIVLKPGTGVAVFRVTTEHTVIEYKVC